jgi:hypothetical protein
VINICALITSSNICLRHRDQRRYGSREVRASTPYIRGVISAVLIVTTIVSSISIEKSGTPACD